LALELQRTAEKIAKILVHTLEKRGNLDVDYSFVAEDQIYYFTVV